MPDFSNLNLANYKVNKKISVAAKSTDTIVVRVPSDAINFISQIGYTKKLDTEYKLLTGKDNFNWGENQVGSQTVPYLFNPPRRCHGNVTFVIENKASVEREYGVSFTFLSTGAISEESDEGSVLPDISRFDERIKITYGVIDGFGDSITNLTGSNGGTSYVVVDTYVLIQTDIDNMTAALLGSQALQWKGTINTNGGGTGLARLRNDRTNTFSNVASGGAGDSTIKTMSLTETTDFQLGDTIELQVAMQSGGFTATATNTEGTKIAVNYSKSPVEDLSGYYCDKVFVAANTTIKLNVSSVYNFTVDTEALFGEPIILRSFEFETGDIIYAFKEA